MASGPLDSSSVPDDGTRLDLGCLRIAIVDGLEVRVDLDSVSHNAQAVSLFLGHSIISLQVFAAPRHEDLWPDIRDGIVHQLSLQGVESDVVMGRFGTEIHTVMPSIDFDGSSVVQSVRFLGVDGPRWFMRAVVTGDGSIQGQKYDDVDDVISNLVVHRGESPMGPGEHLPIIMPDAKLPEEAIDSFTIESSSGDVDEDAELVSHSTESMLREPDAMNESKVRGRRKK